jgi:hypothetical protein
MCKRSQDLVAAVFGDYHLRVDTHRFRLALRAARRPTNVHDLLFEGTGMGQARKPFVFDEQLRDVFGWPPAGDEGQARGAERDGVRARSLHSRSFDPLRRLYLAMLAQIVDDYVAAYEPASAAASQESFRQAQAWVLGDPRDFRIRQDWVANLLQVDLQRMRSGFSRLEADLRRQSRALRSGKLGEWLYPRLARYAERAAVPSPAAPKGRADTRRCRSAMG